MARRSNLTGLVIAQMENKSEKGVGLNAALAEAIVYHKTAVAFLGAEGRGRGRTARKAGQDETAILTPGHSDRRLCRRLIQ